MAEFSRRLRAYGFGVEGGIKYFSLGLEDVNNLDTNLKYDGIYLHGYYNF